MNVVLKIVGYVFLAIVAVIVAGLIATAVIGRESMLGLVFGPVEARAVDFATLRKTDRPNQFLACPLDVCAETPDMVAPVYEMSATDLRDRWLAMLAEQPRVEQLGADETNLHYDFRQRTELMRFPDTITVRFIPLGDMQSTLAVYSRSHYGYSDWGVNQQRVTAWLDALR